ncbi:MAG TPA: beta-propeller fold lactonase family protein [Terracidiphilus sp.]|jgi:6-phosphogluconolactonase (cycloisomerase 2 family)|nr:beta-propeller fold lactonase family protein [Terracidiphilus sp.]
MKFTKSGKTLLMIALSAGVILGLTSCVQSYSVGYLWVTGTNNSASSNNGIISGFKIDHNTGRLATINGLPISSGGANPGRTVLLTGGRFIYVLNRGANAAGTADCTATDPCNGANVTEFAVGGNGVLSPQGQQFFSKGINPTRIIADTSGNFLYVLDQIAPDPTACALALGASVTTCGDITAFKIDSNTGRLTTLLNAQVTSASGQPLPYFPIPANPIDFVLSSSYILTLSGTPTTGDAVFPYTYSAATGQLTVNQNSSQPLNIAQATAIVTAGGDIYVLDNEPGTFTVGQSSTPTTAPGWIFQFTVGANGALQQTSGGSVPDDVTLANPNYLILENKGKFLYVLNEGNNSTASNNSTSGIAGYVLDPATHIPSEISGSPFGTGSGPQCLLEDPSNQFLYTVNFNDSSVTGRLLDQNSGVLKNLNGSGNKTYTLEGPPAWCITSGRTS